MQLMGNGHSLFSCSSLFSSFLRGRREQVGIQRTDIFCVGVSWERQLPSTWAHWLILPQGERQPPFLVHCQATQRESPGVAVEDLCYIYNVSTHCVPGGVTQNVPVAAVTLHNHSITTGEDMISLLGTG